MIMYLLNFPLNSDEIVAVKRTYFLEINFFKHGYDWNKFYKFDDLFIEENKISDNNIIKVCGKLKSTFKTKPLPLK
jgi:hypothetical protein